MATTPELEVRPGDQADWQDVLAVLGSRGMPGRCACQRYMLARGESFAAVPDEVRRDRLHEQVDPGGCGPTAGLVGYVDGEPVAWCAVEPRAAYSGLVRNHGVAWAGRDERRDDPDVWAVTCFVTRTGHRRRGLASAMVPAAVAHAAAAGARVVEGYPMTTTDAITVELHPGTEAMFTRAGFEVVARPTRRRAVVRRVLAGPDGLHEPG